MKRLPCYLVLIGQSPVELLHTSQGDKFTVQYPRKAEDLDFVKRACAAVLRKKRGGIIVFHPLNEKPNLTELAANFGVKEAKITLQVHSTLPQRQRIRIFRPQHVLILEQVGDKFDVVLLGKGDPASWIAALLT